MTNPEQLRPHQVAEQLRNSGYELVDGRIESERLGDLIGRSQSVWRKLAKGKFEENEFGYATIAVEDWEGEVDDRVDALRVIYHSPDGNIVQLGGIARVRNQYRKGTATVTAYEGQQEPLLPQDPRWDAVVGTIERAIISCQDRGERQA